MTYGPQGLESWVPVLGSSNEQVYGIYRFVCPDEADNAQVRREAARAGDCPGFWIGCNGPPPPLLIPSGKYCFVGELFVEYVVTFLHPSSRILYGK